MATSNPQIIPATPSHIPSIKSIITAAFTKYISRIGKPPGPMLADYNELLNTHDVFVLQVSSTKDETNTISPNETASDILGSIVLYDDAESDSIKINNLVVDPAAQGRGYGRLLLEFAQKRARATKRSALTLSTNVKMYENLQLYAKIGFVEIGRREEEGYERVFFQKNLV